MSDSRELSANLSDNLLVALPVFDQKDLTVARYDFDFMAAREYSYILLTHACDKTKIGSIE